MEQIQVTAPAKINLSLDIVGTRPDGYHLLATVMQSLALTDRLTVSVAADGRGIQLFCDRPGITCDENNTAYQAARLYLEQAGLDLSVKITICKRIPVAAGLAGGSSNAAAVLFALNHLMQGRLKLNQLMDLAIQIGADVPFCLQGGTVLCEGIGEKLKPLTAFEGVPLILVNPGFALSTPWAFREYDKQPPVLRPNTSRVIQAMRNYDLAAMAAHTANVLEPIAMAAYPGLQQVRTAIEESGAGMVLMSGSGPTIFGLYSAHQDRDAAYEELQKTLPETMRVFSSETRSSGPVIIM